MHKLEQEGAGETIRRKAGLPPATYFSGGKIQWILDNVDGARAAAERGEAIFGNIDTWLIWNLTGGINGGAHITDVTNASRTMLFNLETLDWDDELLGFFGIPRSMLPAVRPSSDSNFYGMTQRTDPSRAKFLCVLTWATSKPQQSDRFASHPAKLRTLTALATSCFSIRARTSCPHTPDCSQPFVTNLGAERPVYALEGSVAVTGSAVQWLRDQLGIIKQPATSKRFANTVTDNGGVYFVPAFSGLYAPYWRRDARGCIVGLSRFNDKGHLARATLEAICYQTRDVLDAMVKDSGVNLEVLKVDGGATVNDTLMQLQADILGVPVVRPVVAETRRLARLMLPDWLWVLGDVEEMRQNWQADKQWEPRWSADQRAAGYVGWQKAIERTLNWVDLEQH